MEDLRIGKSFKTWQRLEGRNDGSSDRADDWCEAKVASLEEFKNLQNLNNLEIFILNYAKMFPKNLVFKSLETFKIFIGKKSWYGDDLLPRRLVVNEFEASVEFDNEGIKALMTKAESLLLQGVMSSVSVSEMDPEGFPELKYVEVEYRDGIQFIVKKNYNNCIFPKLETMKLHSLYKLERICDDDDHPLLVGSFGNLRVIEVSGCDILKNLLSSNLARDIFSLKEIEVDECESMESIIGSTENQSEEEIQIGFTHQLRVLKLSHLPRLVSFCSFKQLEGLPSTTLLFNKKIMFPELEVLELEKMKIEKIWDIDHLAIAAQGTYRFQNLTSLKISKCDKLSYLFTSSMVKSFTQLKQVEVYDCVSIKEIVAIQEGEMEGEKLLSFPKLESLKLQYLPKLKIFGHVNSLECQSLQMLRIVDCPLLNAFISTNDSTTDQKMVFPKLEILTLIGLKIEKIWHIDHLTIAATGACWFQNITSLEVDGCDNLRYLFTSSMVNSLTRVKQLEVSYCKFIEEIVATVGDVQLSFPNLDSLKLDDLPKLRRFCEANLLKCQVLRELIILDCPKLKTFVSANNDSSSDNSTTLFTEKVAIPNLEELRISSCDSFEKMFDVQILPMNEKETCRVLPFQNLPSVNVFNCESLTSIFPTSLIPTCQQLERLEKVFDVQRLSLNERDTCRNLQSVDVSECPSLISIFPASLVPDLQQLKLLQIEKCEKIDLFDFNNTQQLNDALAKLITSLKDCYLKIGGTVLQKDGILFNLKIEGCDFQVPPIFFALLQNVPELYEVVVSQYSITQLFPCEIDNLAAANGDDMDTQAKTLARIRRLKVINLSNMKQIWSEHSPLAYHGIIEVLEVCYCDSLLTLAPSSTTFLKNLTDLEVVGCGNLRYVFTSSMVKGLAKLQCLRVRNCQSIEEIVASLTERTMVGDIQLSFPKLAYIKLEALPNLKRFCEANLLECQSLEDLVIRDCPELKTFLRANDSSSSDNSKTLFTENVAIPNLAIVGCDSIEKERQILPLMVVSHCQSLTSVFPASLISIGQRLERLQIRNCDKIDLFDFNNTQQLNDALAKVTSRLKYCYLETNGLKLKYEDQRFTLKIVGSDFQVPPIFFALLQSSSKLDKVVVSNYSIAELFSCETDHLAAAADDIDTQAKTPVHIPLLKLTKLPNMKHIWSEHCSLKYHGFPGDPEVLQVIDCGSLLSLAPPSTTLFKNLTGLVVTDCPELIKLVGSSGTAKSLINLKEMRVRDCDSLEEIVVIDDQWDGLATNQECIVFDKLEVLTLQYLSSLTSFCSTSDCNFRFPSLNRAFVSHCPNMKFFSKGALSTPKLTKVVRYDGDEKEQWVGDLNSTIRQMFEKS